MRREVESAEKSLSCPPRLAQRRLTRALSCQRTPVREANIPKQVSRWGIALDVRALRLDVHRSICTPRGPGRAADFRRELDDSVQRRIFQHECRYMTGQDGKQSLRAYDIKHAGSPVGDPHYPSQPERAGATGDRSRALSREGARVVTAVQRYQPAHAGHHQPARI